MFFYVKIYCETIVRDNCIGVSMISIHIFYVCGCMSSFSSCTCFSAT